MKPIRLPDGAVLTVRPIEPGDVDRLARMFDRLSPETVYRRFFTPVQRAPRAMLEQLATVDHNCREALVALDGDEIVAVVRYDAVCGADEAEFAVTVEDAWQHRGVGLRLAARLADEAMDHGFQRFVATMLAENRPALGLVRKLSPEAKVRWDSDGYEAVMELHRAS